MREQNAIHRVAIIGRPNVGKSTLFNRIVGRRHAITEKVAGTTRDRLSANVKKNGMAFEIVDTGGFEMRSKEHIPGLVRRQIEIAVGEADIILFICDVKDGITPLDEEILPLLRKSGRHIMLVVNKVDNKRLEDGVSEFFAFGIEDLFPVSALHGTGTSLLIDGLTKRMREIKPTARKASVPKDAIKVAIVGRPNVGKSSFINKIANEERVIVHEKPGTTRDSIDIHVNKEATDFIFIDTAGMRHKRKIKNVIDIYGLARAKKSIKRSDISVVMLDAYEGFARDDIRILKLVEEFSKGCILVVNKWDLISNMDMPKYEDMLVKRMNYIKSIPVLFISCKTGLNIEEAFRLIRLVYRNAKAKFSEEELDKILGLLRETNRIPAVRSGKLIKIYGIRQEGGILPAFSLFVNNPEFVTADYIEAVKNALRDELGLRGVSMRIVPRKLIRKGGSA